MSNCNCHTKDNRDGSGQLGRYLKALDPSFAPIDDRSIEELLVFAKRYASQVRFYEIPDGKDIPAEKNEKLNWKEFFSRDMAVIAASVSVFNVHTMKEEYEELRERLDEDPSVEKYAALYSIILGLVNRIDRWITVAMPGNPLRDDFDIALPAFLRPQFHLIMVYEEGFKSAGFKATLDLDYSAIENEKLWGLDEKVNPDASIFTGKTPADKLRNAALYADDIFNTFFSYIESLIAKSDKYFTYAVEQFPGHQPHMALFIAFLKIFQLVKTQMNGLTERMLDFYYKDVLQLTPKGPIPDKAHIVFELAKDISVYNLAKGTALKAGKDAAGKDLIYKTGTEIVLNQATVKEIKTIFIDKKPLAATQSNKTIQSIYASPVANSADGLGRPFTDPNPKWPTFGRSIGRDLGDSPNLCDAVDWAKQNLTLKNETQIGFAIATPQLVLQGGNRIIALKLDAVNEIFEERKADTSNKDTTVKRLEILLSGEKEWIRIDNKYSGTKGAELTHALFNGGDLSAIMPQEPCYMLAGRLNMVFIFLPQSAPQIIAYDSKLHKGNAFNTAFPVMQVLLGPGIKISASHFNRLKFSDLHLAVRVGSCNNLLAVPGTDPTENFTPFFDGLKILTLQNDDGAIAPNKKIDPFTPYAKPGNSLYVGSPEVFNKPVNELSVHIKPAMDGAGALFSGGSFRYIVNLLENKSLTDRHIKDSSFTEKRLTANIIGGVVQRSTLSYPAAFENGKTDKGFLELRFSISKNGNANSLLSNTDTQFDNESLAKLGLLLQMKEISLSYFSDLRHIEPGVDQFFHVYPFGTVETYTTPGQEIRKKLGDGADVGNSPGREVLHRKGVATFTGFAKLDAERGGLLVDANELLLPQFTFESLYKKYQAEASRNIVPQETGQITARQLEEASKSSALAKMVLTASGLIEQVTGGNTQYSGVIQEEGMLFIGLEKAVPLESVSLLFQFAEGSAEDEDNDPPPIHWSYLTNNEWRPLKGEDLVSDGTYGFQTTGIVKLNIPADATNMNTIITSGLHWFSASVTEYSNRIPQLISIVAQAVEVVFDDEGNDQSHYDNALPAGTISKLQVAATEISKLKQPFASFDGKHREIGKEFFTRVSERLRHKNRAINTWDYEHLILNRYPSVYKVKAIPHTDTNCLCRNSSKGGAHKKECCGPQVAPGHVLIVPISNLKNRNAVNPLQPKTSKRLMLDIEAWLKKLVSPFVKIHVCNPVYEQVITAFRVKFHEGADKGFYLKKLNEEIVGYLTPWAFDEKADVQFGQKIYASNIINFIEERAYVDFITDFLMGVCKIECCPPSSDKPDKKDNTKTTAIQLAEICGCDGMEAFLSQDVKNSGEIVVAPSTPRSLLVSVSQHIIIPYEEAEPLTPCEKRKLEGSAALGKQIINSLTDIKDPGPLKNPQTAPLKDQPALGAADEKKAQANVEAKKETAANQPEKKAEVVPETRDVIVPTKKADEPIVVTKEKTADVTSVANQKDIIEKDSIKKSVLKSAEAEVASKMKPLDKPIAGAGKKAKSEVKKTAEKTVKKNIGKNKK